MKKVVCFLFALFLGCVPALAEGEVMEEIGRQQFEAAGGNELSQAAQSTFDPEFDYSQAARDLMQGKGADANGLLNKIFAVLFRDMRDSMKSCMKIVLVALCLSALSNFLPKQEKILEVAFYVCYMVIFILGMESFTKAVKIGREAVESMDFFMKAAVPVLGGLMAASGGIAKTAMVSGSILGICAAVGVISSILFPMSMITAVLSGVNNLSPDFHLKKLSKVLKKTAVWGLGLIMTIFAAVVTTQSFAAVNLDNVAGKTVKFAAGNLVPLVGGVLSDTLESVIACGKLVKGAAGGAGVLAVLYICLSPILQLLAIILTYKIAAVIISPVADARLGDAVDEFSSALTMVLAMVISVSIMFMVCTGIIAAI